MDTRRILDRLIERLDTATADVYADFPSLLAPLLEADPIAEHAYNRHIRGCAQRAVVECGEDIDSAYAIMQAIDSMLVLDARTDFDSYMLAMEWDREPEKRFWAPRRKVLLPIAFDLQDLADDRLDLLAVSLPPRVGKALALNTPVLTKEGWKTHGDLSVRDYVIGPDGKYKRVLAVHNLCEMQYEVEFTNGEKMTCHGNHEWVVYDRHKGRECVIETKDMIGKLETGEPGKRGHRYFYQLPSRKPLEGVWQQLPVEPYAFGAWLGDGSNKSPVICNDTRDHAIIDSVVQSYPVSWKTKHKTTGVLYYGFKNLRQDLQKLGFCHSRITVPKHIPDMYLVASEEQRLQLLAGLLDTDGCLIAEEHRYQYTTCEESLKDTFIELVSTFGWRCSVTKCVQNELKKRGINAKKPWYVIAFNPTEHIPCRLERKQLWEFSNPRKISLKSIKPCKDGIEGCCITVEGGVYCAGRTMLPTHNSTICTFFITWIMGRYPERANVMSGHSDKLTQGFYQEALSIVTDSAQYRFAEIFPDAAFKKKDSMNEAIHLKSVRRFPTLTCRSIDGTLTGAVEIGRNALLYCDDLVSDREEALNQNRMDKLYAAYLNQLKDRKLDGAKELHIGTRWVPNDPIGRIEAQYSGNPRYRFSTLPALDGNGNSNFVYERGLGFSTEYYEDMRASLIDAGEEDSWAAKYMCAPYWKEGRLFPESELRFFEVTPEGLPDIVMSVCDSKTTGPDYCVQVIVEVYGDDHYVVDAICDDGMMEQVQPLLVGQLCKWDVAVAFFESNMAGGTIAEEIRKECRRRGSAVEMKTSYTTTNRHGTGRGGYKETRILADAGWVKQHCLFLPENMRNAQYRSFIRQLSAYSAKGKNPHDDAPDAMSMYRRLVQSTATATVTAIERPF